MVIKEKKLKNEKIPKEEKQLKEEKEGKDVNNNKSKEKSNGCSITKLLLDAVKGLLLIILVPAFLNYAAIIKEEKELKPRGVYNFHFIFIEVKVFIFQFLISNCWNKAYG